MKNKKLLAFHHQLIDIIYGKFKLLSFLYILKKNIEKICIFQVFLFIGSEKN